jgi:hypothetical protein
VILRPRCPERQADDLHALTLEDLIEATADFAPIRSVVSLESDHLDFRTFDARAPDLGPSLETDLYM